MLCMELSDVFSALRALGQTLEPSLASISSHFLTFVVIFLSVVLLQDALHRSKQLNWWSSMVVGNNIPGPPGPWWNLPLFGYLPWLGAKPYVTMWNLSRQYGNVYQIRFGSRKVVVINGLDTIRSAFVRQCDVFAGRPDFPSFAVFCEGRSLAFNSAHTDWSGQRKVALRGLGMLFTSKTKYNIETLIQRHAAALADRLLHNSTSAAADAQSSAVDPFDAIESAVVAILFEVCFGEAGDGDDQLYVHMMQMLHEMRDVMPTVQSADVMPWMAPLLRRPLRRYTDSLRRFDQLVTSKVERLVNTGVPDQPACIVHALHHACLAKTIDSSQSEKIAATVQDFIGAGSEGVVNFVHWAILYAAKYPDIVQERVRAEIQRTVGLSSAPVAADRARMPYTEACVWEIIRHSCLAPMSIPHAAMRDAVIAGHSVPAGTVVFANFYSTGWDADVWGDPNTFRPERFLTADGSQLDRKAVDQLMCFGAGKRRCLGAQFGKLEMFMFFVILTQKCAFSAAPGQKLSTDGDFVFTNRAKPYRVLVQTNNEQLRPVY